MTAAADMKRVTQIAEQVTPLLRGLGSELQGLVLADLVSLWLAAHIVPGDPKRTDEVREELMTEHTLLVRELIPESENEILANLEPEGSA